MDRGGPGGRGANQDNLESAYYKLQILELAGILWSHSKLFFFMVEEMKGSVN